MLRALHAARTHIAVASGIALSAYAINVYSQPVKALEPAE